jgi:hypothetical protein
MGDSLAQRGPTFASVCNALASSMHDRVKWLLSSTIYSYQPSTGEVREDPRERVLRE